ncbi:unnamed protein product [Arabis nemorensis]|uniref:Pectinesterase inhibitor domain-containing protein n=1 Tax=Arabis nemorensis TaxID=586526 RepID=A0A565BDC6_9BRAS|nr:unnamed protein product [Arabis nemorensis]
MASSSSSYGSVLVSLALVLQFFLASASTQYIDAICQHVPDKVFCVQTLNGFPPATSATTMFKAAQAVLRLGISYAAKSAAASAKAATENPNLKKQFERCQGEFATIIGNLKNAASELKEDAQAASYDIMICMDSTTIVRNLVGQYSDKDSKNVIIMTSMMDKFLEIDNGAAIAVGW